LIRTVFENSFVPQNAEYIYYYCIDSEFKVQQLPIELCEWEIKKRAEVLSQPLSVAYR